MDIQKDLKRIPTDLTKAEKARILFSHGYSVSEVSKAIPMAYSQAHTLSKHQKAVIAEHTRIVKQVRTPVPAKLKKRIDEEKTKVGKRVDRWIESEGTPARAVENRANLSANPPNIKLKSIGKCVNCGYELKAGKIGGQMQMIHTGASAEDYLDKVQFCHAYPERLK